MKLWLISQDQNRGYDTYDSAIVAAETEVEAQRTHPSDNEDWGKSYSAWAAAPEGVEVRLLGEALPNVAAGVILASFNAS